MLLPNKRLKLAGRSQVRKNCVASPASLFICGSIALRPRALHPQLKRDPLGSGNSWHVRDQMRSVSPSCGALFRCLTAGVALLVACTSQSRLHPPTPEQAVQLDSLKRDPSAVAACAKLSRVDPQAVFLERDVEKPAELLPDQGLPFDRPRREGNAVG